MKISKPRVLVCSVDSFPRMGGVSTLAYEVAQALEGLVSECVYLGPRGTHFGIRPVNFKTYEDWESDLTLRAGEGADLEDERIFDLFKKIAISYQLDAIVAFHPFYYGPAATQAAKFLNISSAVMVHGTEMTSQFPEACERSISAPVNPAGDTLSERLVVTLDRAGTVLANSQYTAAIAKRILPSVSPAVIGCGISQKVLNFLEEKTPNYKAKLKARRRLRLGLRETTTITYVGRLVPHKNLFRLIELGAETGFQVVILGKGPLREKLEAYAMERDVDVQFDENANDDRKWQLLEASDFGYLMSEYDASTGGYEGFGISMLEYCAAGAVCLTGGGYGMADFANHGVTTFDPRNGKGKIDSTALLHLAEDESRMDAIIRSSRASIREEYTWSRVAEKMLEAL